jgi:hypothetical protein
MLSSSLSATYYEAMPRTDVLADGACRGLRQRPKATGEARVRDVTGAGIQIPRANMRATSICRFYGRPDVCPFGHY